jgi:hypothetical protein
VGGRRVALRDCPVGAGGVSTIIRDRSEHVTEQEWATFVSDAEDAVSREHTLWLARHGHPDLPQRPNRAGRPSHDVAAD